MPTGDFERARCAVFAFEAILHDLELQRADGGEERNFLHRIAQLEHLHDAFLQELFEALAELFEFAGIRIVQIRKALGREARDFAELDAGLGGERVADAEFIMADEADDIAGEGVVDGLAILPEKFVRAREADFFVPSDS